MSDASEHDHNAGRIEGGIDAIVIGAGADGLAAAAYLGKAGLQTVLLESGAEIGAEIRRREFTPGAFCIDGEHLVSMLDPETIDDLDLYRHGIAYAARRIDTTYFFESGQSLDLDGDVMNAAAGVDEDEGGGTPFQRFTQHTLEAAALLRPAFAVLPPILRGKSRLRSMEKAMDTTPDAAVRLKRFSMAAADAMLDEYLSDGLLKTALLNETVFRSAAAPHESFSFMNLLRRWAGETSGLQAAIAYPEGGAVSIINALRRAVQAAKVEIRAAAPVKQILIERDCIAGVQLENGGQIRAPIIVAAMDARRVFLDMIGADDIDIEFQRAVSTARPVIASARLHLALSGFARDEKTKENMRRRLVYVLAPDVLRRSFATARAGGVPDDLVIEAIFPNAIDDSVEGEASQILSVMAHPLPFDAEPDPERRDAIKSAILGALEKFAPDIASRIEASDLMLPPDLATISGANPAAYAAKSGVMQQWALAGQTVAAGRIDGLYFCGAEAQIGPGLCCAAGRIAAKAALRHAKHGDVAA
jgi:phytoene dehydrogenase-like protein